MAGTEAFVAAAMARDETPVVAFVAAVRTDADMATTEPSRRYRCQSNIGAGLRSRSSQGVAGLASILMGTTEPVEEERTRARSDRGNGASCIVPEPGVGRLFRTSRSVRLAEADSAGRLRLDAIARIVQDVATDDSHDLGRLRSRTWVVRRTLIEQDTAARYTEGLSLATFCAGLGSRWAERRVSIVGDGGGRIESASLWVHLDPDSGRPAKLPEDFVEVYSVSAQGREITARQTHDPVVPEDDDVHTMPWWPRVTDLDILDHVNNAASWEIVEQSIDRAVERGLFAIDRSGPLRAEVEFRDAIDAAEVRSAMPMTVAYRVVGHRLDVTLWSIDGETAHVTARVEPLPATQ